MANCYPINNYQYNAPNMNEFLIASQLPNVNNVFKND